MKVTRFEELRCWENARVIVKETHLAFEKDNNPNHWHIKSQILRATLSIMNNIAEGFGRFHRNEFIRFLNISLGSILEVQSMLYVIEDINAIPAQKIEILRNLLTENKKQVKALIRYLNQKRS